MANNLDKFFIWERPCFPALVYIGAESCTIPHIKEFGRPWDNTLCFFSDGLVRAVWRKAKMVANGIYITKNFLRPAYYRQKMNVYQGFTQRLLAHFNELDKVVWLKLTDQELLARHRSFNRDFTNWWGLAQVSDLLGMGSEALLRQKRKLTGEQLNTLSAMTYKSYTTVQEENLLRLADKILARGKLAKKFSRGSVNQLTDYLKLREPDFWRLLRQHTKKYFWLLNSYAETKELTEEYFLTAIKDILAKGFTRAAIKKMIKINASQLRGFKQAVRKLEKDLAFSAEEKKLVEFIDYFTFFQDERKAISLKTNHYTDLFLKEVARRAHLHYDLAKYLIPVEYEMVLKGKFPLQSFNLRKKHFSLLFWAKGLEVLQGEPSRKKEEEILGAADAKRVNELEGTRAMGGRVTGRVRKIKQLSELSTMQPGEILVTTMTSPDFIVAMKKAAAVITDQGGVTCHAAVISRELGIPCVIGTSVATRVLNTGDLVEVRANHGLIKILEKS